MLLVFIVVSILLFWDFSSAGNEENFLIEMIAHHQESIEASKLVFETTKNEQLRVLSQQIAIRQDEELGYLKTVLAQNYPKSTKEANYKPMLAPLEQHGSQFADRAYLTGMILHHQKGLAMAQRVLQKDPSPLVEEFANKIILVQTQEIAIMTQMLSGMQ